jgi:hypothetical protein
MWESLRRANIGLKYVIGKSRGQLPIATRKTRRVGSHFGRRKKKMFRSMRKYFVIAVVGCAVMALVAPTMLQASDLAADFGTVNSSGQWTYGFVTSGGVGGVYTLTPYTDGWFWYGTYLRWQDASVPNATIAKNPSAVTQDFGLGPVPAGKVMFHPGNGVDGPATIARWTAAVAGTYSINTVFSAARTLSTVGVRGVHVIQNGSNHLWDSVVTFEDNNASKSFSGQVTLAAGGTIDFALDNYDGSWADDGTLVDATITQVVPEPCSLAMLGMLGVGAGLASLKRVCRR